MSKCIEAAHPCTCIKACVCRGPQSTEVGIRKSFAVLCIEQEVLCDDEEAAKVTVRHDAGCRHLLSVCKGVGKATLMADRLEEEALDSIRACMARIVQAADGESIVGITVDVGYLWLKHQRSLRQLFPQCLVLVTPMVQLPLIRTCFSSRGKTLLVTWEPWGRREPQKGSLVHRPEIVELQQYLRGI